MDDDSRIEWEDVLGEKKASIDDIDRNHLAILQTVNSKGTPLHTLTFNEAQRVVRKAVWRHYAGITPQGERVTIGALTGYNENGNLYIWLVKPTGEVEEVENPRIQLHPAEVFSQIDAENIRIMQEEQNRLTEEDNELLANPVTDPDGSNSI
jgi:hypothetical protein